MRPRSYLLIGSERAANAAMAERLQRDGHHTTTGFSAGDHEPIDGVVLQAESAAFGTAFLDLTDSDVRGALRRFVDLIGSLQQALRQIRERGSIVVVTSRGYLGAWGGAHEMAFSAAIVALIRSVALECMSRRVRANVIAIEFGTGSGAHAASAEQPGTVADIAAFLLSDESRLINGEVLLANSGHSLQMREARDRHGKRVHRNTRG